MNPAADVVTDFVKQGFRIWLLPGGALVVEDLIPRAQGQWPRAPPSDLMTSFGQHADEIGRWLEGSAEKNYLRWAAF